MEMTGLTGRGGGSSAKVALSWQLAYNKAGQGSADVQRTEESHLRAPPPVQRAWESGMWSLVADFHIFSTKSEGRKKKTKKQEKNKAKTTVFFSKIASNTKNQEHT